MSPLLGLHETAKYFGYSTNWVMAQIRTNELPAYRVGNKWRFIPTDLEAWVRQHPQNIRAVTKKQVFRFEVVSSKSPRRSKRTKVTR